jgi:hypothetical protein
VALDRRYRVDHGRSRSQAALLERDIEGAHPLAGRSMRLGTVGHRVEVA